MVVNQWFLKVLIAEATIRHFCKSSKRLLSVISDMYMLLVGKAFQN